MPIVVLRAGETIPEIARRRGEFAGWIEQAIRPDGSGPLREHDLRSAKPLPDPRAAGAFVITGSASSVTERAPWMLRAEAYIQAIVSAGTPLLGICFGHQLMAQALGGHVARNPRGREIGTVRIEQSWEASDALFAGLPRAFDVNATHVDTVTRLPPGARVLAASALEPTAAFSFGATARGVQFHPEIDGDVMRGYVTARADVMLAEGLDPQAALARAQDTPHGAQVLRNFVRELVEGRRRVA